MRSLTPNSNQNLIPVHGYSLFGIYEYLADVN